VAVERGDELVRVSHATALHAQRPLSTATH
jgi:hypothetical protein